MNDYSKKNAIEDHLKECLLDSLDGDAKAYKDFLKQMSSYLRAYFRKRLTALPDEVEDLVQETLLAIHNHRQTFDPTQSLGAWACAIAKYRLVDMMRRRSIREQLNVPLDEDMNLFSHSDADAVEARHDLFKLLNMLPDRFREPIVYTKLEGLSVTETARVTGMSEAAVKIGVHRGLKQLAALFRSDLA